MNARETTLLNKAIAKHKAYIELQKRTKKSERNERNVEDARKRIVTLKSWMN